MPDVGTEQRKLAAIMFTDMVGFSALTQNDEALGLELLEEHRQIVRAGLPQYGGREVKTTGDGFLIVFSSVLEAVRCAMGTQQRLHERNHAVPPKRQILIRIGIHVGDVVFSDADIHGDGVNIAARLEPLALPGGVCVSEDVARQIRNKLAVSTVTLASPELKNIQLPIIVHRLVMPWEAVTSETSPRQHQVRWIVTAPIVGVLVLGACWLIHELAVRGKRASPSASLAAFPRNPDFRRVWALLNETNSTPEDFLLAEDIVKGVVAQHPSDPEAVIVYAWINNSFINRGFDVSEERYVQARRYAERAFTLSPDNPEAIAALGQFLSFRRADMKRAEELLARAMALNPNEPRFHRFMSYNVLNEIKPAEALPFSEQMAARFPHEPLVLYDLAVQYRNAGEIEKMEHACDQALALAPVGAAMVLKAWAAAWWHGDIAAMKSWLDRIPEKLRLTDRVVILRYQYAYLANDPAAALQILTAFPGEWLRDPSYSGPKSLLLADLLAIERKDGLAKVRYEAALAELVREKAHNQFDAALRRAEVFVLIGLKRQDEAQASNSLLSSSTEKAYQPVVLNWWFSRIPTHLLLGERETAVRLIREAAAKPSVRKQILVAMKIDPRMSRWREDAEIANMLAEFSDAKESATASH